MIQYPERKSIIPSLISKQGAGKGTFLSLMSKMLGQEIVFETTDPSRDVWGHLMELW
jgi:ABC-type enterochelin transport system ATPase subunit